MRDNFPSYTLISKTIKVWKEKYSREITRDEAIQILRHLAIFGQLLIKADGFRPAVEPSNVEEGSK